MTAKRHTADRAARDELSHLLAAAYLRLLAAKSRKSPELAQIRPPDSPELSCSVSPPE